MNTTLPTFTSTSIADRRQTYTTYTTNTTNTTNTTLLTRLFIIHIMIIISARAYINMINS